jgi:hypothetical protein
MSQDESLKGRGQSDSQAEVGAIGKILKALSPLKENARLRVLSYVSSWLGIAPIQGGSGSAAVALSQIATTVSPQVSTLPTRTTDIRTLAIEKNPRSAIEMAAVVAYYLAELAATRKDEIDSDDIKKYFKQANFPLPGRATKTLFDARNAGYLDSGGARGTYRLNPVGHNLVAHNLPGSGADTRLAAPRRPKKTRGTRKASKKKIR